MDDACSKWAKPSRFVPVYYLSTLPHAMTTSPLSLLSPPPAALHRAPLVLITGPSAARRALHRTHGALLAAVPHALVADAQAIAPYLPHAKHWRHVLVIASPADIPISLAAIPSAFLSDVILAGVLTSAQHRIIARIVAIRALSNSAVLLARYADEDNDKDGNVKRYEEESAQVSKPVVSSTEGLSSRAREALKAVLKTWAQCLLNADDATVVEMPDLVAAIGEPAWVDGDDVVLPPAWDSLEKVRAMADAHMLDFEGLCTEADALIAEAERVRETRGCMTESREESKVEKSGKKDKREMGSGKSNEMSAKMNLRDETGDEVKVRTDGDVVCWLRLHDEWLARMATRRDEERSERMRTETMTETLPETLPEASEKAKGGEDRATRRNSDFFQRLLAGKR